jgi:hypothetical protein
MRGVLQLLLATVLKKGDYSSALSDRMQMCSSTVLFQEGILTKEELVPRLIIFLV